jgi:hypothetical protein
MARVRSRDLLPLQSFGHAQQDHDPEVAVIAATNQIAALTPTRSATRPASSAPMA